MDIKKVKRRLLFIAFSLLNCTILVSQTEVQELVNRQIMFQLGLMAAPHITSTNAIRNLNNENRELLRDFLEISYDENVYDTNSRSDLNEPHAGTSFAFIQMTALEFSSDWDAVPYYPENKRNYYNEMNDLESFTSGGFLRDLALDHDRMTQSNKQEFYQTMQEINQTRRKQRRNSRRLLYLPLGFFGYQTGLFQSYQFLRLL